VDHPQGFGRARANLLETARREFAEETNLVLPDGEFAALAPVMQNSGKVVHAFALEADLDLARFASNTFEMEWPPKSGRRHPFPEIDRIAYFSVADAMNKILTYQRPLLIELGRRLD
jgi:predicted NUDIX family NTP pyrophosphohydrolase